MNKFPMVKITGNKLSRRTNPMTFIYCQAQLKLKISVEIEVNLASFPTVWFVYDSFCKCIEYNAQNKMHRIQCIANNA